MEVVISCRAESASCCLVFSSALCSAARLFSSSTNAFASFSFDTPACRNNSSFNGVLNSKGKCILTNTAFVNRNNQKLIISADSIVNSNEFMLKSILSAIVCQYMGFCQHATEYDCFLLPHTYIICASHHKLFINNMINSIFSHSELHKNSSNIYLKNLSTFLFFCYMNMNKTITHVV